MNSETFQTEQNRVDKSHKAQIHSTRSKGKIRVFVKSSLTLVSYNATGYPSYMPSPLFPLSPHATASGKRVLVYEMQLDDEQKKVIRDATALAERLGMGVEVTDLGKQNIFKRFASRLTFGNVTTPSIVFSGRSARQIGQIEHGLARQQVVRSLTSTQQEEDSNRSSNSSVPCTVIA